MLWYCLNHTGASGNHHQESGLVSVLAKSEPDLISLPDQIHSLSLPKRKWWAWGWGVEFLSSAVSSSWSEALPLTGIPQLIGILYA